MTNRRRVKILWNEPFSENVMNSDSDGDDVPKKIEKNN